MRGCKTERPSTANTMILVLKPREEEYTNAMPLSGSQKELEAWRKNRVMQMKLGAYLAEVRMQKKSAGRLLKTEEYRFLQEVNRRSSVPRSVAMLEQLELYKEKTFPGADYSYQNQSEAGRGRYTKHAPLSARTPMRRPLQSLLDRPQTSASMIRKSMEDRDLDIDEDVPEEIDNIVEERIYPLADNDCKTPPFTNRQPAADLPFIRRNESSDSLKIDTSLIDETKKVESDVDSGRKSSMASQDRSNSSSKLALHFKAKKDLMTRSTSMSKMSPVGRFGTADTPIHEESTTEYPDFNPELKLDDILTEEFSVFETPFDSAQNTSITEGTQVNEHVFKIQELFNDIDDDKLSIIDLDVIETATRPTSPEKKIPRKSSSKPVKKTNFNRLKEPPILPLRQNITSVLRQEKARYENSQTKVKDFMHKMSSRDTLARGQNSRDTTSAASRRSSARR